MARTSFTGPVYSANGFISGTAAAPITVTTAQNVDSAYVTTSATTGDTRLVYDKLTFTSTGSGETVRALSTVTGVGAAAAGTINGAHISTEIDGSGTISGAANAIRATLGGTSTTPGGTLAAIQLDTNFASGVTLPATSSFIRVTDSGAGAGKVSNLMNIASGTGLLTTGTTGAVAGGLKIRVGSTTYYLLCSTSIS
jgi:hypothetical protein